MKIQFYATLRAVVGTKTIDHPVPDGTTALELAQSLVRRFPGLAEHLFGDNAAQDQIARSVHFMIDGRNLRWLPEGGDTRLAEGQSIDLFPPAAGG